MAKPFYLPDDLVEDILSRVPLTSLSKVRSTCKRWNALSKTRILTGKATEAAEARKRFLGFVLMNSRIFSMNFDLQGVRNDMKFVNPSIKKVSILGQNEISQVFHCDGLLLCVTKTNTKLVVWNPYLGQIKWIKPRKRIYKYYDRYFLGYNKNRNHKILRLLFDDYEQNNNGFGNPPYRFELYDFNSSSWRVLDVKPFFHINFARGVCGAGVSLKGNTYLFAWNETGENILLCFDFTTESFAPFLTLPYNSRPTMMSISCVREEQLVVLYENEGDDDDTTIEIYVTDKIEHNAVSWSKILEIEFLWWNDFLHDFMLALEVGSFFLDVEKKVVVVVDYSKVGDAYIIGDNGYFKIVKIEEAGQLSTRCRGPHVFSSYVPSLVDLQIKQPGKRKERDYLCQKEQKRSRFSSLVP